MNLPPGLAVSGEVTYQPVGLFGGARIKLFANQGDELCIFVFKNISSPGKILNLLIQMMILNVLRYSYGCTLRNY